MLEKRQKSKYKLWRKNILRVNSIFTTVVDGNNVDTILLPCFDRVKSPLLLVGSTEIKTRPVVMNVCPRDCQLLTAVS